MVKKVFGLLFLAILVATQPANPSIYMSSRIIQQPSTAVGDGSLGTNTDSGFNTQTESDNFFFTTYSATAGAVNYIWFKVQYMDNQRVVGGIYDTSGNLIEDTNRLYVTGTGSEVWVRLDLDSEVILTATDYLIGYTTDDTSWRQTYASDGSKTVKRISMSASDATLDSSFTPGSATTDQSSEGMTIMATNSTSSP